MLNRFARLVALALVMTFGAAGAAAAQTTTYDFVFSSSAGNGSGLVTINGSRQVVSVSNFFINGVQQFLDTTGQISTIGGFGTSPTLSSTTAGSLFNTSSPQNLTVSTQPGNTSGHQGYLFYHTSSDFLYDTASGNAGALTETFNAVPGPTPGGGLLSWIVAAMMLAAAGAWRRFKGRGELALA